MLVSVVGILGLLAAGISVLGIVYGLDRRSEPAMRINVEHVRRHAIRQEMDRDKTENPRWLQEPLFLAKAGRGGVR